MAHQPLGIPYCIIGKVSWGVVQAIKVPEDRAALYTGSHGWLVLIRDSEMPTEPPPVTWPILHSNPRRMPDEDQRG